MYYSETRLIKMKGIRKKETNKEKRRSAYMKKNPKNPHYFVRTTNIFTI
jgi:hypothetical protein